MVLPRATRHMENEESQLSRLEEVLGEHRVLQQRMTEVSDKLFDLEAHTVHNGSLPEDLTGFLPNPTVTATSRELQAALGQGFTHVTWQGPSGQAKINGNPVSGLSDQVLIEDSPNDGDPQSGQQRLLHQEKAVLQGPAAVVGDEAKGDSSLRPRSQSNPPI